MSTRKIAAFTAADTAAAWDSAADAWDEFVESGADYYRIHVHGPALLRACSDVRDLRVLDLGCGQGYFARQLAGAGARVVGVDVSPRMIEHARRHERDAPLGIEYAVMDGAGVSARWGTGDFDLVASCMAVHDMPEPAAVLRAAASLLRPGARMVYSTPNPTTDPPYREWERDADGNKLALKIDRYFETGPCEYHWNMPRLPTDFRTPLLHTTLSEITAMIADADLLLRRIHEPRPTPEQVAAQPKLQDCARVPYFLVFDCVKA